MLRNKGDIIHIAPIKATAERIHGEIYISKTTILNWLRACALDENTTEIPRNTVKALIASIESWDEVA